MSTIHANTCTFCGKKCSAPCPTQVVADKCKRNPNNKLEKPKALKRDGKSVILSLFSKK